jgi:two-component sensor histidine kinase
MPRFNDLMTVLRHRPVMAWVWTAALVAAAFVFRYPMNGVLGGSLSYSAFYPAVILSAYAFGRGPAIAATVVSALLGFLFFSAPAYSWQLDPKVLMGAVFFLTSSAVAIVVVTGLTGALRQVSTELGRAQAVADSHAGLFRELNERMTHHMRLVAGVLALQAKGEPEPQVADSLRRAMERSLLISRVHRELAGHTDGPTDLDAFATALARAVCVARDQPADRVIVQPSGLSLGAEETTSLGVALAECLGALFDAGVKGALQIRFGAQGRQAEVAISEADETGEGALVSVSNGYLLRAMTEQLGAAVALRADAQGSALVLSIPRATAAETGSAATFH